MKQSSATKDSSSSRTEAGPSRKPLQLVIKGLGHIPSIKNSMFAIVKKENRDWKRRCVNRFVSQLLSGLAMGEHAIQTPDLARSLIASLPQDDCWKDIPQISIVCEMVAKGEEGAEIVIEPL